MKRRYFIRTPFSPRTSLLNRVNQTFFSTRLLRNVKISRLTQTKTLAQRGKSRLQRPNVPLDKNVERLRVRQKTTKIVKGRRRQLFCTVSYNNFGLTRLVFFSDSNDVPRSFWTFLRYSSSKNNFAASVLASSGTLPGG